MNLRNLDKNKINSIQMGKYIQTLITPYLKKNKFIKKEDLNSTKDSHFENESTAF